MNTEQNYKNSPLGLIPSDWEVKELENIIDNNVKWGFTGGPFGSNLKSSDYTETGVQIIQLQNIGDGVFIDDNQIFTSKEKADELISCNIYPNEIILAKMGDPVARACLMPNKASRYLMASDGIRLVIDEKKCSKKYIHDYINSDFFRKKAIEVSSGSTRLRIGLSELRKLKILIPPLPEQKAIAKVLSIWDEAISKMQALITQKELQKKYLMQNLLTGKKRLKGFVNEWKEVKIKELFTPNKNVNDGLLNHEIMTISAKIGLVSQQEKFDRVIAGESLSKYCLIKKGDFAYNKGNSKTYPMGCIYQLETVNSALVPFVYICFSPTNLIFPTFYKHWFLAHGLDRQLKKIITSGARGDGLLNVNEEDFFSLKIPYPLLEEQTAIAKILEASDKEISLLKQQLESLKTQKKGIMQQLLTGKKRLKVQ